MFHHFLNRPFLFVVSLSAHALAQSIANPFILGGGPQGHETFLCSLVWTAEFRFQDRVGALEPVQIRHLKEQPPVRCEIIPGVLNQLSILEAAFFVE